MEELFTGNNIILFCIAFFYLLIMDNLKINQKIIVVYLFTFFVKYYLILDFKIIISIFFVESFLYFEFLSYDEVKNQILKSLKYKILDYFYQMIFIYSIIPFLISITLLTQFVQNIFLDFQNYLNILSFIFLAFTIKNVSAANYSICSFTKIKHSMDKIKLKYNYSDNSNLKNIYEILLFFEDKSYFIRENNYNMICFDFFKYRYFSEPENFSTLIKKSLFRFIKVIFKTIHSIVKDIIYILKTPLRGYSTIEMQLIRTLGIENGYNYVLKRKIFEFLYSHMFFKSLKKYYISNNIDVKNYKNYLLYIYISVAPVFYNGKRYGNMYRLWGKNKLEDCTIEEIFIGILCLSNKLRFEDVMDYYQPLKEDFDINDDNLKQKIKYLDSLH